ncbi:MAG: transpeptidase family protein [Muribaculaceae bacterium]|nr:transpeptidase family protein [Muribaculaceae bacterium]
MKTSNKQHILFRYLFVISVILLFTGAIIYNMFKTSVVEAKEWNNKADSILTKETVLPPERGRLLSDNGSVLAANLNYYTARIDWTCEGFSSSDFRANVKALSDSLQVFCENKKSASEWEKELMAQFEAHNNKAYPLFKGLTHSQFLRLKSFPFLSLPKNKNGFYSDPIVKRVKPYGQMASRSIGFVGEVKDMEGQHGRSGLEMALDSLLYGVPGVKRRIQLTNRIVDWESTPAVPGYDITTTINVQLQDIVETELYKVCKETDAVWGTCVLMEVQTGEIKAISNLEWSDDLQDYYEGRNNAVLGYEPGSVMKPISMMVALEDGIISDIDAPFADGRAVMEYGESIIKDSHSGAVTPRQIIEMSSNVGMSKIILKKYEKNPDGFRQRLEEMGFFEPFNSGIGGEQQPKIAKLGHANRDRVALTRMAYGYATLIPPLHTLAMYNAIANDGKYVRPHLVKKLTRPGSDHDSIVPITYVRQQVCSPENAKKLRIMLHDVVWGKSGTARRWVQDENVEIAGKTGTAFTVNENDGTYTDEKRLAFCGFFPYEAPKYSCIVLMRRANRGAAASSGLVVRNIAAKMYACGLLGTNDNYDTSSGSKRNTLTNTPYKKSPNLFYQSNSSQIGNLRTFLGLGETLMYNAPSSSVSGVPNVCGMTIREAVVCLEKVGLNVRFNGAGRVVSQSLAAGSEFKKGAIINLTLEI